MFGSNENELGIGYQSSSNLRQTKFRVTNGSGLNVNGSNDEVNSMEAHGPSRIVSRSNMMVIGQRVSRSCLFLSRTVGVTLKGIRRVKDRFMIIGEIRENIEIVPVEARNGSIYFKK